jgi:hypothetical protein
VHEKKPLLAVSTHQCVLASMDAKRAAASNVRATAFAVNQSSITNG